MAKRQKTIWVSRDNGNGAYYFWAKKPYYCRGSGYVKGSLFRVLSHSDVSKIFPHLDLKKRGLKKLTIIVEDVE